MSDGSESAVLVVDAGSSSLHLALVGADGTVGRTRDLPAPDDEPAIRNGLQELASDLNDGESQPRAVGHRLVHGGDRVRETTIVDDAVRRALDEASSLAPLHVPPALRAMDLAREVFADLPHVACVDTAFHAQLPDVAATYALPAEWRNAWGLRRYGFHGLSYAWAMDRAATLLGQPANELRLLLAHLGNGASVCAVRGGRSVDTSMGFTPLEGLVMGTRAGSVDPGMLLWLLQQGYQSLDELADGLQRRSGLLGLSGGRSNDTRELVRLAQGGCQPAALALDVFAYRAARELAAAAVALDRIDGIVFTGEIGADQPEVRASICAALAVLGVSAHGLAPVVDKDAIVSPADASVPVMTVLTGEICQIAREVTNVLTHTTSGRGEE
ncbi:acetate/propionate family kinase [Tenggerimyces flavus]|uniref:Acetate kinase n=1 Tax=Tenggerimyces flavus TaxID=1708749 RepID=A0ABV7YCU7_9ACTN|nr:acetate/propionate family kinase [Tenggerimyces flavus]MBM7786526.1 acetate kinase [Tenggerimyces flavus]